MDGRLFVTDTTPSARFPIYCRGNVGEVFPNVMTPMSSSLLRDPAARGQERMMVEFGMASPAHFVDSDSVLTGVFGGYMYGNVSLGRVGAARIPGLKAADIDRELFGLSDAAPYVRQRGDRDARGSARAMRQMLRALFRADSVAAPARAAGAEVAAWRATLPPIESSDQPTLVNVAAGVSPWFEWMMYHLLFTSAFSGLTRSIVERLVAKFDEPGLVNVLTAGLGTVESARPANELWRLGRLVAVSPTLTALFEDDSPGLHARLRAERRAEQFNAGFDAFLAAHGARGPDEWELASPTWGDSPEIALAAIDRLRLAPGARDPILATERLGDERERRIADVRQRLRIGERSIFDRAVRATGLFAAEREATKASFMRAVEPSKQALTELARRAAVAHDDLFLVTFDELPQLLADPSSVAALIDQRRARRAYLQVRTPPFWFEHRQPPPETWPLRSDLARPDERARVLTGMGVCPGIASGRARVVLDPADPRDLGADDVLIAPITDPAWTPLFLAVAGVVVDVGAQQSHAAIVARELGIPAVVSVTDASRTIPDGTLVTVNGTTGEVTVH